MQEIDYLLRFNNEGILTFDESHSALAQIREWLDTPKGTVWGRPSWGNLLGQYKHLPINDDTAASMEGFILLSIATDLPHVHIRRIRVMPLHSIDAYRLIVEVNGAAFDEELQL